MTGKNLYFISEYEGDYFFHGGIGIIDAENILRKNGFVQLRLPHHFNFSIWAKIARLLYCLRLLRSLPADSIVVFIFPLHARMARWLAAKLNSRRGVHVICFIADIDGLKDGDPDLLKRELKELDQFNYFVVHNRAMLEWLNRNLAGKTVSMINFFDFLTVPVNRSHNKGNTIVFAGNLAKSGFLGRIGELPLRFNLYGPGVSQSITAQSNVDYKGIFDPYRLPSTIKGCFGLVWDGESAKGMEGSLGDYMAYISHHKLSLYILSGLPVIISCTAGGAELVTKYGIGFCVKSLEEIRQKIDLLDEETYQQMVRNTRPLATKIAEGKGLTEALEQLIEKMD